MTFKPTLWATVAAAIAVLILIGLGNWQLDRREWKSQVIETRAQRITAPAMTILDVGDVDAAEYRPIRLTGRYRAGDSIKLLSRTRDGRPGFHVVTPLEIDGAAGVVLEIGQDCVGFDLRGKQVLLQLAGGRISINVPGSDNSRMNAGDS